MGYRENEPAPAWPFFAGLVKRLTTLTSVLFLGLLAAAGLHFYVNLHAQFVQFSVGGVLLIGVPFLVALISLSFAPRSRLVRAIIVLMIIGTCIQNYGSFDAMGRDSRALGLLVSFLFSWVCGLLLTPVALVAVFSRLQKGLDGPLDASTDTANPTVESDARKSGARGSP